MKLVKYSLFAANTQTNDIERAVLPTIMYAHKKDGIATAHALSIGWWCWGIGIIRTKVKE